MQTAPVNPLAGVVVSQEVVYVGEEPFLSRLTRAGALLSVVALVAGCSGGSVATSPTLASTSSAASSSAPPAPPAAPAGTKFKGPKGAYTLVLGKGWTRITNSTAKGTDTWGVAPASGGYKPIVYATSEGAQGLDLPGYLDAALQTMKKMKINLISRKTVVGTNGRTLGMLELAGPITAGSRTFKIHFLAVIDLNNDQAVMVTLASTEPVFSKTRAKVEPFLMTVNAA